MATLGASSTSIPAQTTEGTATITSGDALNATRVPIVVPPEAVSVGAPVAHRTSITTADGATRPTDTTTSVGGPGTEYVKLLVKLVAGGSVGASPTTVMPCEWDPTDAAFYDEDPNDTPPTSILMAASTTTRVVIVVKNDSAYIWAAIPQLQTGVTVTIQAESYA